MTALSFRLSPEQKLPALPASTINAIASSAAALTISSRSLSRSAVPTALTTFGLALKIHRAGPRDSVSIMPRAPRACYEDPPAHRQADGSSSAYAQDRSGS